MTGLSSELQALVRSSYGALMLLTLGAALPHARRYFLSERWGGYTAPSPVADALQNPVVVVGVLAGWVWASAALMLGVAVTPAAVFNFACCYYFFNHLRWTSVSRGMGAPGFIALWLGAAVLLLEFTARHAPAVHEVALLTLQVDFGAIMLSAGLYKLAAGYRHSHGMELGMVNPEWGYWPSFWKSWPPGHPLFRALDEMAWSTEVVCGLLMLIPGTRAIGGAGILISFILIATQIRLGFLCEMVIVCCLLFFGPGTAVSDWVARVWPSIGLPRAPVGAILPMPLQAALSAACWGYVILLPVARAGLFYNQLRHRRLPAPIQRALDAYANVFGLILWRVFTADVVNFFVHVWEETGSNAARRLVSVYRRTGPSRFAQVAECIALTSVFTTLKYYPSNRSLFTERLLRYARTIPRASGSRLIFEWVSVAAMPDRFAFVPIAEYAVDVSAGTVTDRVLSDATPGHEVPGSSPVHEGSTPGSYAPLNPEPRTPNP